MASRVSTTSVRRWRRCAVSRSGKRLAAAPSGAARWLRHCLLLPPSGCAVTGMTAKGWRKQMHTRLLILCGLLVAGAAQADTDVNVDVDYDADDIVLRSEQGSMPAAGIEQLYLESEVGEITLTATDTDIITWRLEIVANDNHGTPGRQEREWAADAELSAVRADKQARLTFVWPGGAKHSEDLHERWTITVPVRLA